VVGATPPFLRPGSAESLRLAGSTHNHLATPPWGEHVPRRLLLKLLGTVSALPRSTLGCR
jgi:hypothetical protein